jgi:hypothetical protein
MTIMHIDRNQFLALVVSVGASCAPASSGPPPAAPQSPQPTGAITAPSSVPCVGFDPTNECVAWGDGSRAQGYAMTNECVRWDPTNECTAWEYTRE